MFRQPTVQFPFTASDGLLDYDGVIQRIRTSEREIDNLGSHLDVLGAEKILVVCGPNILAKSDVVERVEKAAGERVVGRFSGAQPHAPLDVLDAAHALAQQLRPDTIVSVGGGSTMAIAKGIALLDATDESVETFAMRFEPPDRFVTPSFYPTVRQKVVSIPTTIGCAEFGRAVGGFTTSDRKQKVVIAGDGQTGPHLIVIDGLALATTPVTVQRATTMGQLRLAIETFASVRHNPLADALTLHAMRLIVGALRSDWEQTPTTLLRIKTAAALASMGLVAVGSMGACSAIAHQLGSICGISHGEGNAIMLAPVIRFNAAAVGPRLTLIADALGVSYAEDERLDDIGERIADLVTSLNLQLGIPTRLRDYGIEQSSFEAVATAAMGDPSLYGNPRPVNEDEVCSLLESAW